MILTKRLHCYSSQLIASQRVAYTQEGAQNFASGICWPCVAVPGHSLILSVLSLKLLKTQNGTMVAATSGTLLLVQQKMQSCTQELISYVNNCIMTPRLKICNKKPHIYCNVNITTNEMELRKINDYLLY